MRLSILTISLLISTVFNLTAQVNMQEDAQALLQTCVRDTKNIEPVSCTDNEIMKIAVTEVMRVKEYNKPNTVINLDIQIAVNERGTITEVLVNKNSNTLENLVSKKLQAIGTLFPARKNGVFVASVLNYHIDDATLTDYVLIDNREGIIVGSYEMAPPIAAPRGYDTDPDSIAAIPFMVMEEPPMTKKCASLETLKERQTCFYDFANNYVTNALRKYLEKMEMNENQRIPITFIIDTNGKIKDVVVRAKDPAVAKEINRIMENFPKVLPGKQRGRVVNTQFAIFYKS
ncbi:MAG: hypothetical protein NWQ09_08885 [Nonlabens sp.]|nr:hypothetical protein [Nonlabens sp.]